MTDGKAESAGAEQGLHGHKPALQVICLGSGGGPSEENVTGLLVRSIASDWAKGSLLAVDAGSHLAPILRILERDFPSVSEDAKAPRANPPASRPQTKDEGMSALSRISTRTSLSPTPSEEPAKPEPKVLENGPFAGLSFPNASARANALHILRNYVSTYLITHPHLDHLSGFAINTAAFHATARPKTLAALPSTVDAIKLHIFNDVIWPNLTDEDGGVGFVTFQRLREGGDLMIGEGEGRGYIEVSDGLGVKPFKVSHGVCTKSPPSHHHRGSIPSLYEPQPHHHTSEPAAGMARTVSLSGNSQFSNSTTPTIPARQTFYNSTVSSPHMAGVDMKSCVVDSTAYFVRDIESNREVLIFGDVEPDSISLNPRTYLVWQEAARKIAHGLLGGVFIECSYDDTQADAVLFGHLNPQHLIAELQNLAAMVVDAKAARHFERGAKKRKRSGPNGLDVVATHAVVDYVENDRKRSRSLATRAAAKDRRRSSVPETTRMNNVSSPSPRTITSEPQQRDHAPPSQPRNHHEPVSPRTVRVAPSTSGSASAAAAAAPVATEEPLRGIKIVIIHIKDTMKDGPHVRDSILAQLQRHEARLRAEGNALGCEFVVSRDGESYWF